MKAYNYAHWTTSLVGIAVRNLIVCLLMLALLVGYKPSHSKACAPIVDLPWLQKQLNGLVVEDLNHVMNLNGKKAKPLFSFDNDLVIVHTSLGANQLSFSLYYNWTFSLLKQVSYDKTKDNEYVLIFPASEHKPRLDAKFKRVAVSSNIPDNETCRFLLKAASEETVKQIVTELRSLGR